MKKNKTLRLHRQHDLDLITLYRARGFSFSKEVRNILVAYVNREPYNAPEIDYENVDLGYIPTTIQYHLSLNPEDAREQAVLDMLHNEIKYGYMNSFIKALVRAYIPRIPFIGYGVADGFITRRITATDVGIKMREAQKTEYEKVRAETLTVNELDSDVSALASEQSVPAVAVPKDMISSEHEAKASQFEPRDTISNEIKTDHVSIQSETKQQETVYEPIRQEPEDTQKQIQTVPDDVKSEEEYEEDDDEDDFDDFFKTAQSFTGV